jgi:hypothetical protein
LQAACGDTASVSGGGEDLEDKVARALTETVPSPTPTPEPPFIVAEGEERRVLMAGTPQATSLYIFGSGRPGPRLMVLGGVHGNEPGGWFAADRLLETLRPTDGAFLIIPRANLLADGAFVRTTPELGDLNRLYPGDPNGLPMAQMAHQITETAREFRVTHFVDMHESWAFYNNRSQNGTAYLGQTVATDPSGPAGADLARSVVEAVNRRILYPHEEMFYRERGANANNQPNQGFSGNVAPSNQGQGNPSGGGSSSLGMPRHIPGLVAALLVEMGQQQGLDRRIALHVDVVREVARQTGLIPQA